MARLELKEVTKHFGKETAVDTVSLDFEDGEFTVLIGPSGCGKTTTLRMIAGLEETDGGSIYLDNEKINDLPPRSRDMAMVFQKYSLYPHLCVRDNIVFGLKARKFPKSEIEEKINWVSRMLHIEHLLDRRPHQLSGGEQQRVAIGRALVRNPRVYLLDEPLSNLDAKLRIEMREELKRLHQQLHITTIYVTHDQAEAMSLGDFLVVMDQGKVIQHGKPIEVYKNPEHVFVAGFIGNPAMNLIYGKVREEGGQLVLLNDNLRFQLPQAIAISLKKASYSREDDYVLGIRPEHIRIGEESIKAEIIVMEPLGFETLALVRLGGHEVRLRLNNNIFLEPGNVVDCVFPDEHIHLFHRPSGKAIFSG